MLVDVITLIGWSCIAFAIFGLLAYLSDKVEAREARRQNDDV